MAPYSKGPFGDRMREVQDRKAVIASVRVRPFNDTFAEKADHNAEKGMAGGKIGGTFVLSQSDYVICGLPNDELIVMSADARYLSPEGMGTKSEGQAHSLRLQLDHRI